MARNANAWHSAQRGILGWLHRLALLLAAWGCWGHAAAVRAEPPAEVRAARVRAELWGGDTFTGHGQWLHDPYFVHAVEWEWMLLAHVAMSLRGLPLLAYFDRPAIAGAGFGVTNRLYWGRDGSGLYVGPQIAVVLHYDRFEGNSSNVNLFSSLEVGYQFRHMPLRIGVKLEHMSNANLASHNRGWDGISLMIGVSLWQAGRGTSLRAQ